MSVRSVFRGIRASRHFSKILVASVLAGASSLGTVRAADNPGGEISQAVQDVFKRCEEAVVKIEAVDHGNLVGTGFFIDPNGTIYTTYSIGGESREIVVSYGDKKYPASRLLGDQRSGIALLKVDATTPFLPIAKSGTLAVATPVLSIGYPMALPLTPSLGVVAGLDAKDQAGNYFYTTHIRATLPVQGGQGGSPLLNLKGEVVGIVVSSLAYGGPGCYALPIEAAEKIRMNYVRFGDIHHGWIGMNVLTTKNKAGDQTIVVNDLLNSTPAAKCGLKAGDFLLQIGDKKITSLEDIIDASFYLTAGDEVPITVMRNDKALTVKVQPIPDEMNMPVSTKVATPPPQGIPLGLPH